MIDFRNTSNRDYVDSLFKKCTDSINKEFETMVTSDNTSKTAFSHIVYNNNFEELCLTLMLCRNKSNFFRTSAVVWADAYYLFVSHLNPAFDHSIRHTNISANEICKNLENIPENFISGLMKYISDNFEMVHTVPMFFTDASVDEVIPVAVEYRISTQNIELMAPEIIKKDTLATVTAITDGRVLFNNIPKSELKNRIYGSEVKASLVRALIKTLEAEEHLYKYSARKPTLSLDRGMNGGPG